MTQKTVAVNELNRRVGDSHHNAKLSDDEVELLLALHDEGWGYRRLAAKFEIAKTTVRNYCNGKYRHQLATTQREAGDTEYARRGGARNTALSPQSTGHGTEPSPNSQPRRERRG